MLRHEGGEITTGEAVKAGITALLDAERNERGTKPTSAPSTKKVTSNPWVITMSDNAFQRLPSQV